MYGQKGSRCQRFGITILGMQISFVVGLLVMVALLGAALVTMQRRRKQARELYQHHLEDALADGVLSEEEAERLANLREDQALSAEEVRMVALTIYRRALRNAVADARITQEEEATLQRLQRLLGLTQADLRDDREQMQRVHLFARIEVGELPRVNAPVPLDNGEVCHWVVQARLAQKLTIPGPARPPLARVSYRIDTVTPFLVSGERDPLQRSEEVLPLDLGMLLITSRRTMFRGARRTATLAHLKLERVELYSDGLRLEVGDGGPGLLFLVDDAELTAAIAITAARARRAELRGAGRTA
jgi:envelope transporter Tic110